MGLPATKLLTYAEYLAAEELAVEKHHFVDGEMFAMSGGSRVHSALQTRLLGRLVVGLEGRRCVPHGSELRVHLPHLGEACYADALVICGRFEASPIDPQATTNPTVVCEVLSPSTEGYDRGRKFEKYRGLASLREYVLLAQDRPLVELFRREPDGGWRLQEFRAGDSLELRSLGLNLPIDDLYRGVFDEEPTE